MEELESLQEIAENDSARQLFLRMALLSREDRLEPFLTELAADEELDDGTKGAVTELAHDHTFLAAVEEYLLSTPSVR
jgi:hypothetical protein